MRWRLNPGFNEVCLVRSPGAPPAEGRLIAADVAATRVDEWFRRDGVMQLGEVCRALDGLTTRDRPEGQRRRVQYALADGRLRAYRLPNNLAGQYRPPPEEEEHEPVEAEVKEHALYVELVYPNDAAADGIAYRRTRPDASGTSGTTGKDGLIEEDPAIAGIHVIELKEVEGVFWQKPRMRVDEKTNIEVTACGLDDGTSVKLRIFREHRELDKEVVDQVEAQVKNNRAVARWGYDPAAISADHAAEQGVARFIAEARVGDSWSKTLEAIEVELCTVLEAHWTRDVGVVGQPAEIVIKTLGIADGEKAQLKFFELGHEIDDEKIADLEIEISGGEGRASWAFPLKSKEDALWLSPECFFEAKLAGREVASNVIWFRRQEGGR